MLFQGQPSSNKQLKYSQEAKEVFHELFIGQTNKQTEQKNTWPIK